MVLDTHLCFLVVSEIKCQFCKRQFAMVHIHVYMALWSQATVLLAS